MALDHLRAKRAPRMRRERMFSLPPFFNQALDRNSGYLLRAFANLLDLGKHLFQVNMLRPRRPYLCNELASLRDSDPFAPSGSFRQFRELLLGLEQSNFAHVPLPQSHSR